jgi:pimeloyl-ACP methyl ester carboxylesterase
VPVVTANGIAHHVQDLGAGPPVVMVHGLLIGSLASWYFTAAPVLARTHRVRVYDLRGHGKSAPAATGYDVRTLAGDLGALAGEEPVDLVGHSWGALVALRFAIDHPARVRRIVLVEAPLPPSSVAEMNAFLAGGDVAAALPAQMQINGRRGERLVRALSRLVLESSLVDDLRGERDPEPAELACVRAPTLVVYGDRSTCAPGGERLARAIPGARHLVLAGGHYLHLDAREALAAAIAEHLDG